MGFLAPWFLAGAVAIGLPVYLHLLRRHRAEPRPFSSLMFFERRLESSTKHRRLRHLVLLALRVALLILVAVVFAEPFIRRPVASAASRKLLVLAIDNSFSMRAGTRLADARQAALSVLASRKPNERAEVMSLGSEVRVLTQPTADPATLRAAVESVQPTDSRATFGGLAHSVRSLAENTQSPVELHLFSDMQRTAMPANFSQMALPGNVSLVLHRVTEKAIPNWTVTSIEAPGRVSNPKNTPVRAVIAGYDTPAATRTASLIVNRKLIATQRVDVPAGGRATVVFPALDVPYGLSRCAVKIDSADALPGDDAVRFGVVRLDPEPVLFVHERGDTRSPLYYRAALESASKDAFKLHEVTVDGLAGIKPSAYAFVVESDVFSLPTPFQSALLKYVRGGGSLFVATGTSAARSSRIPIFGGSVRGATDYSQNGSQFMTIGQTDRSYPSAHNTDGWDKVKFYFVVRVDEANARVIASLADHTPVLLEKRIGNGRVLLFASGLDNLTSDFPLHPAFVPFVEETARYLSGLERQGGSRVVDSAVELNAGSGKAASVEVFGADGKPGRFLNPAPSADLRLATAGFYELHRASGRPEVLGVNPDRRESDLAVIPADLASLWRGAHGNQQQNSRGGTAPQTEPYALWWYAMILLLVIAVAESLFAGRYLKELREEP
ncbi:MAG TPA: BatA and WFA domain-containing protein [Terriglobia bacterium]|nr:BatA and WFA domain-containing protein [Terriglobia bacterium]